MFDGPGAPAPVEEGFITTPDGVQLHYRKAGSQQPVIVVPLEAYLWSALAPVAGRGTVIAYDLRSRGRSSATDAIGIRNDVADLETVRSHFNLDRMIPIGYSYLGLMVAMYAREHPDRVERLVQLAPAGMTPEERAIKATDDGNPPKESVEKRDAMMKSGAIETSARESCEADLDVFRYFLVGDPAKAGRIESHCDLENEQPKRLWKTFQRLMSPSTPTVLKADDLKGVVAPVLVIHGTRDRNAAYAGGRNWAQSFPNARLLTVNGAAHGVLWEEPETVVNAIRMFVSGEWPEAAETVC